MGRLISLSWLGQARPAVQCFCWSYRKNSILCALSPGKMSFPLFHIDDSFRSWFDRRLTGQRFMIPYGKNNEHGSTSICKTRSAQLMVLESVVPPTLKEIFLLKRKVYVMMGPILYFPGEGKCLSFPLFVHWNRDLLQLNRVAKLAHGQRSRSDK